MKKISSAQYWFSRYLSGGNSGAGSYGTLAQYKAKVINEIIRQYSIKDVVEFGSGDGNQCSMFEVENYTGIDISKTVIESCKDKFKNKDGWNFFHDGDKNTQHIKAPLTLSLDVIFHLVEDAVFSEYMTRLFNASSDLVLIYSSNHCDNSKTSRHVLHREYTNWISTNKKNFKLLKEWDNPYNFYEGSDPDITSFSHFKLFKRVDR